MSTPMSLVTVLSVNAYRQESLRLSEAMGCVSTADVAAELRSEWARTVGWREVHAGVFHRNLPGKVTMEVNTTGDDAVVTRRATDSLTTSGVIQAAKGKVWQKQRQRQLEEAVDEPVVEQQYNLAVRQLAANIYIQLAPRQAQSAGYRIARPPTIKRDLNRNIYEMELPLQVKVSA